MDRAGLVGEDGETHMGLYDIAYMLAVPEMTVTAPKDGDGDARRCCARRRRTRSGPFSIRYPRDASPDKPPADRRRSSRCRTARGKCCAAAADVAILAVGTMVLPSLAAAETLAAEGLDVTVVNCRFLKPYDEVTLAAMLADHKQILVVEEGTVVNGFGAFMSAVDRAARLVGPRAAHGVPDRVIHAASRARQLAACGLDAAGIARSRARAARERGAGGVIRLGVVGHRGYDELPAVLRTLQRARAGARARARTTSASCSRSRSGGQLLDDPERARRAAHARRRRHAAPRRAPHLAARRADPRHQPRAARLSHLLQRATSCRTR